MREKFLARVVNGYRITIPSLVRKRLGLGIGDVLDVEISRNSDSEKKEA